MHQPAIKNRIYTEMTVRWRRGRLSWCKRVGGGDNSVGDGEMLESVMMEYMREFYIL